MSTPLPLHSAPDSPQHSQGHQHVSPTPSTPPLNLPLHLNVVQHSHQPREPPHFSALIGKTLAIDKTTNVIVEEVIAEGGFGVIFVVKNPGDKVKYALKRVVVNSARDYEGVLGEVAVMSVISPKSTNLLRSLGHVISGYGSGTFEVQNLMPLCSRNLLQLASQKMQKSQQFEPPEILQILQHVSQGLSYLHSSTPSIIHRDIKIENVLILDDTYLLSDFGSATVKLWDPQHDSIQAIQEDLDKNTTLQYRSPEMVDLYGGRGAISVASDVWALGVCGFKLMSFKDPFESILAIQNRNLNWSSTKSRYPEQLVLLIECLLAEHQTVRPPVDEVIKMTSAALVSSDWTGVQTCYSRIAEDKKTREEASVKKQTTQSANVVMETTVTPRQRPKRGLVAAAPAVPVAVAGAVAVSSGTVIIPPVLAPPKSPKPVSPGPPQGGDAAGSARFFSPPSAPATNTISPTQQPATPSPTPLTSTPHQQWISSGGSYNPFDDDYRAPPTAPSCSDTDSTPTTTDTSTNEEPEFDVFANAPFDYFKYQPIMMGGSGAQEENAYYYTNYAPNNPFLYPEQDYATQHSSLGNNNNNNGSTLVSGVCNLSFDDTAANNNNISNVSSSE